MWFENVLIPSTRFAFRTAQLLRAQNARNLNKQITAHNARSLFRPKSLLATQATSPHRTIIVARSCIGRADKAQTWKCWNAVWTHTHTVERFVNVSFLPLSRSLPNFPALLVIVRASNLLQKQVYKVSQGPLQLYCVSSSKPQPLAPARGIAPREASLSFWMTLDRVSTSTYLFFLKSATSVDTTCMKCL